MDPVTPFKIMKEALALFQALRKVVSLKDKLKSKEQIQSIEELKIQVIQLLHGLQHELKEAPKEFSDLGLDLGQPFSEIYSSLAENATWNTVRKFKSLRGRVYSIYERLSVLVDDATGLLICIHREEELQNAMEHSFKKGQELDALFLEGRPVKDIVKEMLDIVHQLLLQLKVEVFK